MKGCVFLGIILNGLVVPALAQPAIVSGGVVNGASFAQGQAVAPGSLVSIFGTGLASGLAVADSVPLSTSMNGVSVTFNNIPAPLLFVSTGQINAQLPWELPAGNATAVVTNNGAASPATTIQVGSVSPGVFALASGQAIAINNADGTLAAPAGSIAGLTTHPANRGDAVIIYADGLGPVTPAVGDGQIAGYTPLAVTLNTPIVLVGGAQAQVLFSGLTPQFVGVNQVNIIVPQSAPTGGQVSLQIQMGGITSTSQVTMAVQ
jgi:uncharacterized protein (TIGR03437 family)